MGGYFSPRHLTAAGRLADDVYLVSKVMYHLQNIPVRGGVTAHISMLNKLTPVMY